MGVVALFAAAWCFQAVFQGQIETNAAEPVSFVTQDELATTLADERDVVLVEFCVPSGCSRCERMKTPIDRLAVDQHEWLTVRRVNLRQHLQLIVELSLTECPSYVAFRDGEEVFRADCPTSVDLIASGLDRALDDFAANPLAQSNL